MPSKCSVESCDGLGGHRFPQEREVKNRWIRALKRTDFVPSISSVICSRHFTENDYNSIGRETGIALTRKRLKRGAVPSLGLPEVEPSSKRCEETACDPAEASSSHQEVPSIRRPRILRVISPLKLLKQGVQSQFDEVITGGLDQPNGEYTSNIDGVEDPLQQAASPSRSPSRSPSLSTDEREETGRPGDSLPAHIIIKEEVCVENDLEAFSTSQNNIKQEGGGEDNTPALEPLNYNEEIMSSEVQKLRRELKTVRECLAKKTKEAEMMTSTLVSRINQLEDQLLAVIDGDEQPRPLKLTYLVERSLQKIKDPLYNLVEAEKELRTLEEKSMPPQWSFTVTSRGILLIYANNIGKSGWPVSRCITILPDMTLDIQVVNGPPPKLDLGPMTCLVDILCAMKTTATLRLCTGLDGKCVAKGYLEPDAHVGHERCLDCQNESRRLLSSTRTKTPPPVDPDEESLKAKELISVRRKVSFFKRKLDLAEDHIIQLKSENIKLKRLRDSKISEGLAVEKALDCIEKHFLSSD